MSKSEHQPAYDLFKRMAGDWVGEDRLAPSEWAPEGMKGTGRRSLNLILGGSAVAVDYRFEVDGKSMYSAHGVYAFDPEEKAFLLHWFDSASKAKYQLFRGREEGGVLTFESTTGKRRERSINDFSARGKLTTRFETSEDGREWKEQYRGEYTVNP